MKEGLMQTDLATTNQLRSLFKPSSWLTKIDFINHLVLFNNVLITVLAEKSGGKTSFSSLLLHHLDQQIKPLFMSIHPPCDKGAMLNTIAAQLHLNVDAYTNVNSIVAQINERKAHVLLVLDDAQNMPEDFIKELMLAIRNQEEGGFFHVCVLSDYSIVATLNNLAANQFNNLIHTIELGALSENEARTYVLQRAMAARLITKPLSDAQFKQFYHATKGTIARINTNLDSFILKCSKQKVSNKATLVKNAALAASIAVISGLSFLYFKDNHNFPQYSAQPPLEQNISSILPAIKNAMVESISVTQESLPSYISSLRESSVIQLVQKELPKKQILDRADAEQSHNPINTMELADKIMVIPAVKKQLAERLVTSQLKKAPAHRLNTKTPIKHAAIKQKKTVVQRVARSSGYTIQLLASHRKGDVYRLQRSCTLYAATKIRTFTDSKGSWYVLTIGDFNSRAQAQAKVTQLPTALVKLKPWVRTVSGLRQQG